MKLKYFRICGGPPKRKLPVCAYGGTKEVRKCSWVRDRLLVRKR